MYNMYGIKRTFKLIICILEISDTLITNTILLEYTFFIIPYLTCPLHVYFKINNWQLICLIIHLIDRIKNVFFIFFHTETYFMIYYLDDG